MPASSDTFDPAVRSEKIAYGADELVSCDKCGRANAPDRLECIYCGATLNVDPNVLDKVSVRPLESWEPGTSLVITGGTANAAQATHLLSIDPPQLTEILESGTPLPVARLEAKAAALMSTKLSGLGLVTRLVDDTDLDLKHPPVRVAAMRFEPDALALIDLNTRHEHTFAPNALILIVKGTFSSGKVDSFEKRRLRSTTVTSETVTSADEAVLDLYFSGNEIGFRIQLSGFDYSCLGADMAPLATENMSRLLNRLQSSAPGAKFADYSPVRHLLTGIWDIEMRRDPKGLQQTGFGKREFGVVHSTSNVEQFTRFSRLQRLML